VEETAGAYQLRQPRLVNRMDKAVNISCTLSFRTQFWLAQSVFARSRFGLFFYGIFIGIPVLALGTIPVQPAQWTSHPANLLGFMWMPAVPLLVLPLSTALGIWRLRRRHAWLRSVLRFVITPDAFEAHGDGFDVRLRWDIFQRIIETPVPFCFMSGPRRRTLFRKLASHRQPTCKIFARLSVRR
jgi:hypothetical protein